MAQSSSTPPPTVHQERNLWDGVSNWLEKAERDYWGEVERKLTVPPPRQAGAPTRAAQPATGKGSSPASEEVSGGWLDRLWAWFWTSERDYRREVVRPLTTPSGKSISEGTPPVVTGVPAISAPGAKTGNSRLQGEAADSPPETSGGAAGADGTARQQAEAQKAEAARQVEEARLAAHKRAEEARQQAEAQKAEAARQSDEALRIAQERRDELRRAELRRKARIAEAKKAGPDAASPTTPATPPQPRADTEPAISGAPTTPKPMEDVAKQAAKDAAESLATARQQLAARPPTRRAAPVIEQGSREPRVTRPRQHRVVASHVRKRRPSCQHAGRRITPPGLYVVRAGDSVWRIAELHYDDGSLYPLIMRANGRTGDNMLIHPCQKIRIPRL